MTLSIIIISYNTAELTRQTLQSVATDLDHSQDIKKETEILVVDNNSTDKSVQALKDFAQAHQELIFTLIENKTNVGFAKANNQAVVQSQGEYVLLLNSDTIVQPGALSALVKTFSQNPVNLTTAQLASTPQLVDRLGIVAAQLLNPDGTLQAQGGSFPTLFSLATHLLLLDDIPLVGKWLPSTQHTGKRAKIRKNKLTAIDWVGGTAMLVRKGVFEEVGLLDEAIFMYGEDVEFCVRAQNHHWDVAIQPAAQIIHLGSASSSSSNAIKGELKGYLYIWAKHKPFWQRPIVTFLIRLGCRLRIWLFGTILQDKVKAQIYQEVLSEVHP